MNQIRRVITVCIVALLSALPSAMQAQSKIETADQLSGTIGTIDARHAGRNVLLLLPSSASGKRFNFIRLSEPIKPAIECCVSVEYGVPVTNASSVTEVVQQIRTAV